MTQALKAIPIYTPIVMAAILVCLVATVFAWSTYTTQTSTAHREMENQAVAIGQHAEQVFSEIEKRFIELSLQINNEKALLRAGELKTINRLSSFLERTRILSRLEVFDANAGLIVATGESIFPSHNVSDQDFYQTHSNQLIKGAYVGYARHNQETAENYIPISVALRNERDELLGILVGWLDTGYFLDFYQALNLGNKDVIAILRQDGWVIVRKPMDPQMLERNFSHAPAFQHFQSDQRGVFEEVYIHDKGVRITGFKNIDRFGLTVMVGRDKSDLLRHWWTMIDILVIAVVTILVGFFIVAKVLSFYVQSKKSAEAQLHKSEERFKHFAETASDWLWEMDANLRFVYVSQTADKLDFDLQQAIGKTREEIFGGNNGSEQWQDHLSDLKTHKPFSDFEYAIKVNDKSPLRHVRISGSPIFSDDGHFLGYRGTGSDITSRLKTKEQLEIANQTLSHNIETQHVLFKIASISLSDCSLDELLNKILEQVLSIRSFSLENKGCIFTIDKEANELVLRAERNLPPHLLRTCARVASGYCLCGKAMEEMETVFANHINDQHEVRYKNMEDHGHYILPIRNNGTLLGVLNLYLAKGHTYNEKEVMTLTAISDTIAGIITRRQFEDNLIQAQLDAEQSGRAKSDFLSSMSHELRTPLNAILGFAQILEMVTSEKLSETEKGYLKDIQNGGQNLLELIEQVLQFQRIEFGDIPLTIESIQLSDIVNHCMRVVDIRARDAQVHVFNQVEAKELPSLQTDRSRMIQVVLNLLINAIKYNEAGGTVEISAEKISDRYVRVYIKDNGFGIPTEKQADLFKPFNRLGREALAIGGAGIGLTVSRQLMTVLGGHIDFISELQVGSTFWVDVPI